ncbi:MAG: hypothetical protein Q8O67_07800 [Deltaproteobacteria bacterium]|nr:hypothetical protein [Deltaproteobacteria bacterium]
MLRRRRRLARPCGRLAPLLLFLLGLGACFDNALGGDVVVKCAAGVDCPAELLCAVATGRCVALEDECQRADGREAVAVDDGAPCEQGICVRGACVAARCGDGLSGDPEECDDGNDVDGDACTNSCTEAVCGDGVVQLGVDPCDDGNDVDGDGCDGDCSISGCGNGITAGSEACDDDNAIDDDGCTNACALPRCGDTIVQLGEDCDDDAFAPGGSGVDGDGCNACSLDVCGDGVVFVGVEACDDGPGAGVSGDGCRADCRKIEECGDRVVDDNEDCDDGNDNDGDSCSGCSAVTWSASVLVRGTAGLDPNGLAFRTAGFALERGNRAVLFSSTLVGRLDDDGQITLVAGTGFFGSFGDGGPASIATVNPTAVAVDGRGQLFIADARNHVIRKIDVDGIITTIAGTAGVRGSTGDGGLAVIARVDAPAGIAVDGRGNVYFSEPATHRVRRIALDGTIDRFAGTGTAGATGDNGQARVATLDTPTALAVDAAGGVFITQPARVRRVDVDGVIRAFAGTGSTFVSGDDGAAVAAGIGDVIAIAVDGDELLLATPSRVGPPGPTFPGTVRRVDAAGIIRGLTNEVTLPRAVAADSTGRVLVLDDRTLVAVNSDQSLTVVSPGGLQQVSDEGRSALSRDARVFGLAIAGDDTLLAADQEQDTVVGVDVDGLLSTKAGNGSVGNGGDGGLAVFATLNNPTGIDVDADGRVFICDAANLSVRVIGTDGVITRLVGSGGQLELSPLDGPTDVAIAPDGTVFIVDVHRVVIADGLGVTVVAGDGTPGFVADGQPATRLNNPVAIAFDLQGRLLITDSFNARVRRLEADGTLTTVAGNGGFGFTGDGGQATSAQIGIPVGLAVASDGRLFIADIQNAAVRVVAPDGVISTVVGQAGAPLGGDGGPASAAGMISPLALAIDRRGRLYIADVDADVVRVVDVDGDGSIRSVLGLVDPVGVGPFTIGTLRFPTESVVVDGVWFAASPTGNLWRAQLQDEVLDVVVGYPTGTAAGNARFSRLLRDPAGVAFDDVNRTLFIAERGLGSLRVVNADDVDDAGAWSIAGDVAFGAASQPAGLAFDGANRRVLISDVGDHCLRAVDADSFAVTEVAGVCGTLGFLDGPEALFFQPSHIAVAAGGALYVSDTGNQRVRRIDVDGVTETILGDGAASSGGGGSPARVFPVDTPAQLALDSAGNLFVASRNTVREIANVDGDADADGDDLVITIYGETPRDSFPETVTQCLATLSLVDDDQLLVADRCQGMLIRLDR